MKTTILLLVTAAFLTARAGAASCDSLASLSLPDTTITLAQSVGAGEFPAPDPPARGPAGPPPNLFKDLPAFCRVAATIAPTKDSGIKIEVWMPAASWNNKFQAVGNRGWAGPICSP